MKKLLLISIILFTVLYGNAQCFPSVASGNAAKVAENLGVSKADSGYQYINFADTSHFGCLNSVPNLQILVNDTLYRRNKTATQWVKVLGSGGSSGVTSVGLSVPATLLSVTGSPITSSGTFTMTLVNTTNYTLFGRGSGTGAPSYIASIDSNWIPTLHTQAYYDGRYLQSLSGLTAGGDLTGTYPNPTLIVVNSNPGIYGDSTKTLVATVDSKGRISNITVKTIQIAESQVTNLVSDLAGKQAALGFTPENVANKTATASTSTTTYPNWLGVENYVTSIPVGTDTTINITSVTPSIAGKIKTFTIPYSALTGAKIRAGTNVTVTPNSDSSYTINASGGGGSGTLNNNYVVPTAVKTGNYRLVPHDYVIDSLIGSNIIDTLPLNATDSTVIGGKSISGIGTVTFLCSGTDVINNLGGATSIIMTTQSEGMILQYKASKKVWYVVTHEYASSQLALKKDSGITYVTPYQLNTASPWAAEAPLGVIYNKYNWINTTDFTNGASSGLTYSLSTGYVNIQGVSTVTYNNYAAVLAQRPTQLPRFTYTIIFKMLTTPAAGTVGFGIGLKTCNTHGAAGDFTAYINTTNSGSSGFLNIVRSDGANTYATGSSSNTVHLNDVIQLTVNYADSIVTATEINLTTGITSTPLSWTAAPSTTIGPFFTNCNFHFLTFGAAQYQIQRITISSDAKKNANIVEVSNSKGSFACTSAKGRLVNQLGLVYPSTVLWAGGSNQLQDIYNQNEELSALNASQYLMLDCISNDVRYGRTNTQVETDFDALYTKLAGGGAKVYIALLPEDSTGGSSGSGVGLTAIKNYIASKYASVYIDTWDSLSTGNVLKSIYNSGDGVHPNQLCNNKADSVVITSGLLGVINANRRVTLTVPDNQDIKISGDSIYNYSVDKAINYVGHWTVNGSLTTGIIQDNGIVAGISLSPLVPITGGTFNVTGIVGINGSGAGLLFADRANTQTVADYLIYDQAGVLKIFSSHTGRDAILFDSTGTIGLFGTSSGMVSVKAQAAAGNYNFNLPIAAGSIGQALTSGGGVANPMTWSTVSSIVASNYISAQTSAQTIVTTTSSAAADTSYQINAYVDVTTLGAAVINTTCTYTNENNVSTTATFFVMGSTSTAGGLIAGSSNYPPMFIRAKASTTITVATTYTGTGGTYNAKASIILTP